MALTEQDKLTILERKYRRSEPTLLEFKFGYIQGNNLLWSEAQAYPGIECLILEYESNVSYYQGATKQDIYVWMLLSEMVLCCVPAIENLSKSIPKVGNWKLGFVGSF